ncbi:MAG: ATP-binding protein [Lachnospiraceae bacterium]|nr:ATP-binding protein [Lachnospiraceae bacterium]
MKELTLRAETENLNQVLDFVNALLEEKNCPMYVVYELDIAVEELFVNIAHYAYTPKKGDATIQLSFENGSVIITLIDSGIPYNPWTKEDPDTTLSLEERQIGGLGIYMVKNSMDEVDYVYRDGKNVVTIKKSILSDLEEN